MPIKATHMHHYYFVYHFIEPYHILDSATKLYKYKGNVWVPENLRKRK